MAQPTYRNPDGYTVAEDPLGNWRVVGPDGKLGAFAKAPRILTEQKQLSPRATEVEEVLKELATLRPLLNELSAAHKVNRVDLNLLIRSNIMLRRGLTTLIERAAQVAEKIERSAEAEALKEPMEQVYRLLQKLTAAQQHISEEIVRRSVEQQKGFQRIEQKLDVQTEEIRDVGAGQARTREVTERISSAVEDLRQRASQPSHGSGAAPAAPLPKKPAIEAAQAAPEPKSQPKKEESAIAQAHERAKERTVGERRVPRWAIPLAAAILLVLFAGPRAWHSLPATWGAQEQRAQQPAAPAAGLKLEKQKETDKAQESADFRTALIASVEQLNERLAGIEEAVRKGQEPPASQQPEAPKQESKGYIPQDVQAACKGLGIQFSTPYAQMTPHELSAAFARCEEARLLRQPGGRPFSEGGYNCRPIPGFPGARYCG